MRVVLTTGVFDLFHPGHLHHLIESRKLGDQLIVAVTADEHVNKGPDRPRYPVDQRMAIIRSLRFVDFVLCNDWPTPHQIIRYVRPQIYTKHREYEGNLIEQDALDEVGARVVFTDWKVYSSSKLLESER